MVGSALVLALGMVGAAVGCSIAGMASHGVMSRIEEGHGKFIGLSAIPASHAIYAFIFMLLLRNAVNAGGVSAMSAAFIGGGVGAAILFAAIYQGLCCATAIQATARQATVFGKTLIAIGIVESFSLFAFVFGLLLI